MRLLADLAQALAEVTRDASRDFLEGLQRMSYQAGELFPFVHGAFACSMGKTVHMTLTIKRLHGRNLGHPDGQHFHAFRLDATHCRIHGEACHVSSDFHVGIDLESRPGKQGRLYQRGCREHGFQFVVVGSPGRIGQYQPSRYKNKHVS